MTTEDDARRIALSLPESFEKPYDNLPGFRVRHNSKDHLFARIREAPDALVVWRLHIKEKEALIESEPAKFFQTPHYERHPAVLVRLEEISLQELEDVLILSWTIRAPKKLVAQFDGVGNRPD